MYAVTTDFRLKKSFLYTFYQGCAIPIGCARLFVLAWFWLAFWSGRHACLPLWTPIRIKENSLDQSQLPSKYIGQSQAVPWLLDDTGRRMNDKWFFRHREIVLGQVGNKHHEYFMKKESSEHVWFDLGAMNELWKLIGFWGTPLFSTCPLEMAIFYWSFLSYLFVPSPVVFDKQDERRRCWSTYLCQK